MLELLRIFSKLGSTTDQLILAKIMSQICEWPRASFRVWVYLLHRTEKYVREFSKKQA